MATIWFVPPNLERLNALSANCLPGHLGIEFTEFGDDYLRARMPVERQVMQPFGLLHGGASVALAETMGSVGATLCIDPVRKICVGLEINANHVRSVRHGYVQGTARPIHLGNSTHVWDIRIHDDHDHLVCVARLTMAILDQKG
jgi:1,4-dihydroxy-2-naphthoyl-CoA hydrolase